MLEKFFKLRENGTKVQTEILAGLITFMTMAYILAVNPDILAVSGMPRGGIFVATVLAATVGSAMMGLLSNYPFALAPGLGINAFFSYTVVLMMGYSWQFALLAVFVEGIIFFILSLSAVREKLFNCIPISLKAAVAVGIGLFIALIGFSNAGIVIGQNDGAATAVDLAAFTKPSTILALAGLIIITILVIQKVRGAIFIGMILTAVIGNVCQFAFGIEMGITPPTNWVPHVDFSMFGQCFVGFGELFSAPIASITAVLITLLMVDMFDTIGTLIGAANKAGYLDENGNLPKIERAMLADALATSAGAVFGTSTVTTYVESTSGIAAGGRTGLTSTVTGLCFAFALVLSPLLGFVPTAATAPVLIIVGIMMCSSLKDIDWPDLEVAFPCFFTVVGMPFFYSITDGIAFGFISYVIVKIARAKFKEVHPLMYVICGLFVIMYVITGLQSLGIL